MSGIESEDINYLGLILAECFKLNGEDNLTSVLSEALLGSDRVDETNIIDSILEMAESQRLIANAITPLDAGPGRCASGGVVVSLTESVMGVASGLVRIADAIESLADAGKQFLEARDAE
jgi:uncharacterized protein with PhoU and TrkA domain